MGVLQGLVANDGLLYAFWRGIPGDNRIWHSTWNGTGPWSPQAVFGGNSSTGPSLGAVNGQVYAAWKGEWNDPRIFYSIYNGVAWSPQTSLSNVYGDTGPALAGFNGAMYMAWKNAADQSLWSMSFNGRLWSPPGNVPNVASSVGPSLAEYNNRLYMAWKGMNDDQGIWYSSFDGRTWTAQALIPNVASSVGPTLAVLGNKLYAIWKGMNTDQALYWSAFDGVRWTAQQVIPNVASSEGPVACQYNGKIWAMWKGMGTDTGLYMASFDGTTWSAQNRNMPGNSGQDSLPLVAAPSGGLGSNSNYIVYDSSGKNLTNATVEIWITQEVACSAGFSFQMNCYCPSPTGNNCAWQQYSIVVLNNTMSGVINNWPVNWQGPNGTYNDLILEWFTLTSLSSNAIPAGWKLTIVLQNDGNDNITGATFTVVDNTGATKATVSKTLLGFGYSGFTAADQAPINAYELNLVGPDNSLSVTLTSGQGILTLAATNSLTALNVEPKGDLSIGTAETANSFYSKLPASYPTGDFSQFFSTSAYLAPVAGKPRLRALRKPE